jgi:hypothetical protein
MEQTLAPGGVCNLGSLNLTRFINDDATGFDLDKIKKFTRYMNRFLDNINSLSSAPLKEYVDSMRKKRRVGIGIMGWGSALYMLKVRFGSERAAELREEVMSTIAREAYMSSIDLAEEKGMFELCQPHRHIQNPFIQSLDLPSDYIEKLKNVGIRNSSLLSIQPTGNCVTKNGTILLSSGKSITLENLLKTVVNDINSLYEGDVVKLNNEYSIPTFEGEDVFDSVYVNGTQPVLKMILSNGDTLEQTENHMYLVKTSDTTADWVESKDLKAGMKIIKMK